MDKYETLVAAAVQALRGEDDNRIRTSIDALGDLDAKELIAELCVWIEDYALEGDVDVLLSASRLPLPDQPRVLVDAVLANDLVALNEYANGDFVVLLASMLALAACLQDVVESKAGA